MDPRLTNAARLQRAKQYAEAETLYQQILQAQPKNVDALLLLGLLLHETGRHQLAIDALRRGVRVNPHMPELRQTLVGPLLALDRLPEAIVEARELVRLKPMVAESHQGLASLLLRKRDFDEALPNIRRMIELAPRMALGHYMLGQVMIGQQRFLDALVTIDRAMAIDPKLPGLMADRGYVLKSLGRLDEAIAALQAALTINPQDLTAINNIGACYMLTARNQGAISCFEAAGRMVPHRPEPPNNVGAVLKESGRLDESIPYFEKALQLDPTYGLAASNLGNVLGTLGHHEKAIAAYRLALEMTPQFSGAFSNLLMLLISMPDVSREEVFAEHLKFARWYEDPVKSERRPFTGDTGQDKRLRIGYVSPDFREHSIRYFIEPILTGHDRAHFEVICYATGERRDTQTDRLATRADQWHSATGLTPPQFAELVRSHKIDILVDLAGHTAENSLEMFARRPAPVQVTYLGYPTTTGLTAMDYRLTDAIADPETQLESPAAVPLGPDASGDAFYTEKRVRLPQAFFVYAGDPTLAFDPTLPADRNGFLTFGSFNNFTKINPDLLDAWAEILAAVPSSRLVMKSKPLENPSTQQMIRSTFARRGISADRLRMLNWVTLDEHHALSGSLDLMLDSYPYNGHTTSCQSIWMGAAVLTRAGDTFRSRVGLSMMTQLDLLDFVTYSREQYVKRAIELATDLTRLRSLRPTLRDRMAASSLCDTAGFCQGLEAAYRKMSAER